MTTGRKTGRTIERSGIERSLAELYAADPERADALAFGRRGTLKGTALATMGAALGATIPFAARMPEGLLPAALAQAPATPPAAAGAAAGAAPAGPPLLRMDGKAPLLLLGERPLVAETPESMLDDDVTPVDKFFVRNNGQIPERFAADPKSWRLKIDGEVNTPLDLSVGDLESRFEVVTLRLQMECGGNGRAAFVPETRGNQWGNGAISCGEWTGVRLRDVIRAAGPKDTARFTGHFGADPHLSGDTTRQAINRGMPIAKAMEETTLVAFRLNGQPIPQLHGFPLRLITPGWPGSLSQKWLNRILLRATPHDGAGMGGTSYRVPVSPIVPGSRNDGKDFADIQSMPVRGLLTNLAHGSRLAAGTRRLPLQGQAWAGDRTVRAVHVSADFGASWTEMRVNDAPNRHAWQRWQGDVALPSDGYFELWTRATDSDGRMQPHAAANWNPQGYAANAMARTAILVG